jgi:hypothetical protein
MRAPLLRRIACPSPVATDKDRLTFWSRRLPMTFPPIRKRVVS